MNAPEIIPEDILTSTVRDFLHQRALPFAYGQWQVVAADEEIQRLPGRHLGEYTSGFTSSFVYRDVESDRYYRATLTYDFDGILPGQKQEAVRVVRKMVPVYEEV